MTGLRPRFISGALAAVVLTGCVASPASDRTSVEVQTDTRLAEGELDLRREGQERAIRRATLRVRTRTCFGTGVGSGFVIGDDVLVTNRHVVEGADAIQLSTWDGRSIDVGLSGIAITEDLAIVQVLGDVQTILDLHHSPAPGDEVMAVGYPGGRELSFSYGEVVDRVDTTVFGTPTEAIRVTNEIIPGNSGGPLLDEQGRVVGIVHAYEPRSGYGVAVPVESLLRLAESRGFFDNPSPC